MRNEGVGFQDRPQSWWMTFQKTPNYPSIEEDIKVDVAIVGGGLVGILCAHLLKQAQTTVAVIEADGIVQGTTAHTTAKITSQHGLIYSKLLKNMGREKAQQHAEANEHAIAFMREIIAEKDIDCDFSMQPAYVFTQSEEYVSQIEAEVEAAVSLGIKAHYLETIPLPFPIKGAERFDDQAQFHPRKFLLALAKGIPGEGSHIFEQSRAIDFHEGSPCEVITKSGHRVMADKVIIASHFPAYGSNGYYFARLRPERSYALGVRVEEEFPQGMYINAETPTRSLRSTPYESGELVILAGEHHRTGQAANTNTHYLDLMKFAKETFSVIDMPFRWSAQDYYTLDDVPYVGQITKKSPDVYVATGFCKWGISNGIAAAMVLRDLIVKGKSPWGPVYDPSRFEADPMVKNFVKSNIPVAKHLVQDKIKPTAAERELSVGEALVTERDGNKIGLYKDEQGKTHSIDITCTHLGCELAWNAAELSWDCPCHGSRFTYKGDIIEGPALKSLKTEDIRFNPSVRD